MAMVRWSDRIGLALAMLVAACTGNSSDGNGGTGAAGGDQATGGSGDGGTGGVGTGTAGATTGGSSGAAMGGGATGGGSAGGASGAATGGAARGGAATGGASAGGTVTGGASTGGASGATTGGGATGGGRAGGSSGASTGGASTGGASTAGAGNGGAGNGGAAGGSCVAAKLLWFEDFETEDYSRWTSNTYDGTWMDGVSDCEANGFSTTEAVSPSHSHRSEITCAFSESHRGYGGLQFDGDDVVPAYTNTGTGIDAPYGVVNTFYSRVETPHVYGGGEVTWFSFWTVNHSCDWSEEVLTLGLEDPSHRLAAAHYQAGGGTRTYTPDTPGFPFYEWVRITIYVNYYDGVMHVWQNGQDQSHVTFVRSANTICQWHWGAYASADNYDVVLYEDDNYIYKLEESWTDFSREPYLGVDVPLCN